MMLRVVGTVCSLAIGFLFVSPLLASERPNVLLICVDDLRPELGAFGVEYISSPNIDRLADEGMLFERHYAQAPTCGASRFALLTGRYGPGSNQALFDRADAIAGGVGVTPSLPAWFRSRGYRTVSIGKVSHHPGGLGGKDWNDPSRQEMPLSWDLNLMPSALWQHPRGAMHGLANGEIRVGASSMAVFQSVKGDDRLYPDGYITEAAMEQVDALADSEEPFFLAVGIIRPHLPFGAPKEYLDRYWDVTLPPTPYPEKPGHRSTWHRSGEFMKYNRWGQDPNADPAFAEAVRRHYAACVSYADAQVGRVLRRLRELGLRENTIVALWGDHGWHLGEHGIWGKHALFEESLRSPLILSSPDRQEAGVSTRAIVESVDLYPTLCDLAGLEIPNGLDGRTLRPILNEPGQNEGLAFSYRRQGERTVRTPHYRLILHQDGYVELYDHRTVAGETRNIADREPTVVEKLTQLIEANLPEERRL